MPSRTVNPANQPAIDYLVIGYDICRDPGDTERRHAFNNAINAMRACCDHITTLEQARRVPSVGSGTMGGVVVEAAQGL